MPEFDPQTSKYIDPTTGQALFGGAARNKCIADAGGQDKVQAKAYQQGLMDGHAKGFQEGFQEGFDLGREVGAKDAYLSVDERLKKIEALIGGK